MSEQPTNPILPPKNIHMPISFTRQFIDHYENIYHYVKSIKTPKNILFAKGKEIKDINKSKYDIIYCLPKQIKKVLTNKSCQLNASYSIPTYVEISDKSLNGLWLEKPIFGSCGNGISLLVDPMCWKKEKHILQKYIIPMLYQGYKFDIRILACYCSNGTRYIVQDGIMRYASKKFEIDIDPIRHITNISYQKYCPEFSTVEKFPQLLSMMPYYKRIMRKINKIINDILDNVCQMTKTKFKSAGVFRILGFDIIFDNKENGYFIECNSTPDIFYTNAVLKKFIDDNIYKLINFGIKHTTL